jgi:hypothetical protein
VTGAAAVQPVKRPWRRLFLVGVALVLLPAVPSLHQFVPWLPLVMPVDRTLLLMLPVIAALSLVSWREGDRFSLVIVWLALGALVFTQPAGPQAATFTLMVRGWALLFAACFGIMSIISPVQPFFARALATSGITMAIAFALAANGPGGVNRVGRVIRSEFDRRNAQTLGMLEKRFEDPQLTATSGQASAIQAWWRSEAQPTLQALPGYTSNVSAALLALESIAVAAFAWALQHRFARVPPGPPLSRFREFRFNDQLIWGLAVGATIFLLPPFAEGRTAGLNLLVFFGALYVVRGIAVIACAIRTRTVMTAAVFFAVIAWPVAAILAGGIGVVDTWIDWRNRITA